MPADKISKNYRIGEYMRKNSWSIQFLLLVFLSLIGCNSLDKEYAIVREIQQEGHAKDMEVLTPEKIAMSGFDKERDHIVSLHLSNQDLTALSSKIGGLKYLKRLNIEGNKLKALPSEIGDLPHLSELSLSENSLSELPVQFAQLDSLKVLDLTNNNFKEVPPQIYDLENLSELFIGSNNITAIDKSLLSMEKLSDLNISENHICSHDETMNNWLLEHAGADWRSSQNCE
jgi:hypothetical protein